MNKIERQIERLEDEPDWHKIRHHGLNVVESEVWHNICCDAAISLRLLNDVAKAADEAAGEDEHGRYLKFTGVDALVEALAAWKEHSDE